MLIFLIMDAGKKKNTQKVSKNNEISEQKPKIMLWREKYPEGIGYIVNMRAVLK